MIKSYMIVSMKSPYTLPILKHKDLSEKEMNYVNKEKEYFKILSKLHDITQQIRNYDHQEVPEDTKSKSKSKNSSNGSGGGSDDSSKEKEKEKEEEKEEEEEEEDKSIIIHHVKPINSTLNLIKQEINEDKTNNKSKNKSKNKGNKKIDNDDNNNNNNSNSNSGSSNNSSSSSSGNEHVKDTPPSTITTTTTTTSSSSLPSSISNSKKIRQKYSYQHLLHLQQKLKKEFLRYFNDNQKQLDNIYLIKELKIPSTLYKLIQESHKMWTKFLNTYRKLEMSLQKLEESTREEDLTLDNTKNAIHKLNLNYEEHDK
ncbi:hypothetical protein PIROE2DRAFT_17530, partial [Piromyces sp. E2]